MATTLSDAITEVRSLIDEPTAQFWSDAELTSWINEACSVIARRCETKQAQSTQSITANTQSFTAPDDTLRIHRLEFAPTNSTNIYTLEFRGYMEMDQIWGINQEWPATYPLYYTLWKNPPALKVIMYPVPSEAGTANIFYFQLATPAVETTDDIDIIPGYEDMVYNFASYRALRKDADPRWKEFKQDYMEAMQTLYDRSRTYQDQANFFSTGQAALPAWLTSPDL